MDLTKTGRFKRIKADSVKAAGKRMSNPGMMLRRHTGLMDRLNGRSRGIRGTADAQVDIVKSIETALRISFSKIAIILAVVVVVAIGVMIGMKAYTQSRQVNVRIESGIIPREMVTTARTVGELLSQNDIRLGSNDEVSPSLNTRLTQSMVVVVEKAMIVFITSNNQISQLYMTGGTVEDALAKSKIVCNQDDEITPSLEKPLSPGMRIKHVAVSKVIISEKHTIANQTVFMNSSSVLQGKSELGQKGHSGVQSRVINITYKDGVEVSRVEMSNALVVQPKDRIIYRGTKVLPEKTQPPRATRKPGSKPTTETKTTPHPTKKTDPQPTATPPAGGGVYADVKREDLLIPSIPSQFDSMLLMQITAYTHTGRHTARGNWPQYTRTRKKPGTIAVDSKSIPYGTLLYVTGYGYCVAEDTGANKGDSSKMGDVFMNNNSECIRWGRRRGVKVYIVQSDYHR